VSIDPTALFEMFWVGLRALKSPHNRDSLGLLRAFKSPYINARRVNSNTVFKNICGKANACADKEKHLNEKKS